MDLSIIIINWNSADYVRECLRSIYNQTKNLDFEVIVVDNASFDGCASISEEFPGVIFIQSKDNIGFGKANNMGFQHTKGRTLLFLNPDTKIMESAINTMCSYLETLPNAGAVGCQLLNADGSIQTSCVQVFPTILNQILDIDYLKIKFPKLKLLGFNPLLTNGVPKEVEAVSGACLMIKRTAFEKIEKFTPDYFMYTEDIDICFKVHHAGFSVYYLSDAQVIHYGGGSSKKHVNEIGTVLMRESIGKFFQMRRGKLSAAGYRFSMTIASVMRLILIGILFLCSSSPEDKLKFRNAYKKWKNILSWSLGCERWASDLK